LHNSAIMKVAMTLLASIFLAWVAVFLISEEHLTISILVVGLSTAILLGGAFYARLFWGRYSFLEKCLSILLFSSFIGAGLVSYDIGPLTLFPFRILLLVILVLIIVERIKGKFKWNDRVTFQPILLFLSLWVSYGIISIAWAPVVSEGIKEIIYLFTGISVVVLVMFIYQKNINYLEFYWIWIVMTVFLVFIGMVNHFGHYHLPHSRIYTAPWYQKDIPTAVFVNENDYASFLAISLFFLVSLVHHSRNRLVKGAGLLVMALAIYLVVVTASRANYLAIAVGFFFWYVFLLTKREKIQVLFVTVAAGGTISLLLFEKVANILLIVWEQFSSLFTDSHKPEASVDIRANLLKNALHFIEKSYGFGIGAGNIEYYMENYPLYNTFGDYNMHNWWMELFVHYGALIFILYVLMFFYLIYAIYRIYLLSDDVTVKQISEALVCGLVVFILASISPNSFMALTYNWTLIAFAVGFVNIHKYHIMLGGK
jgi:teichuronic acid biosynthesis protein TuaE